jgi:anti-sigma-K factor RskA
MAMTPIDHGELREQVELYVLGALTSSEHAAFETHLATCDECQTSVRAMSAAADALSHAVPQLEPSPSLRARVLTSAGVKVRSSAATRSTLLVAPWLMAAASLVAAVTLGGYALVMRGRVTSIEERLRDAARQAALAESRIADLQKTSAQGQFQVAVLAAPDLQRIDLAGRPVAPASAGRAFWSRSRGLVFTASNLPALPAGRTYQLWVLTKQPTPVSAGLFKPDAEGRITTTFETPADLPQPIGMAVTIEPDGGVPLPTGEMYLVSS